jgi:hypothetical protein
MARNSYNETVLSALENLLRSPGFEDKIGSLKFTQADKKTVGKIFIKSGNAYAVKVGNYPVRLTRRIIESDILNPDHAEQVLQKYNPDVDDPTIVDYVLVYQMASEKQMVTFVKDYFLGAWDELSSWTNVSAEWVDRDDTNDFKVPLVHPQKLIDLAGNRRDRISQIASSLTLNPEQLDDLKYQVIHELETEDVVATKLAALGTGEYTVSDASKRLGLPPFIAKQNLYQLWAERYIQFLYDNQFPIVYSDPEEEGQYEEEVVESPQEAPANEELANDILPIQPIIIEDPLPLEVEPTPVTSYARPVAPVYSEPETIEVSSAEEEDYSIDVEEEENEAVEEALVEEPRVDEVPENIVVEEEIEPEIEPEVQAQPEPLKKVEPLTTIEPNNRMALIAKQLADELEKFRSEINDAKANIAYHEDTINTAQTVMDEQRTLMNVSRDAREKEIDRLNEAQRQYEEAVEFVRKIG